MVSELIFDDAAARFARILKSRFQPVIFFFFFLGGGGGGGEAREVHLNCELRTKYSKFVKEAHNSFKQFPALKL